MKNENINALHFDNNSEKFRIRILALDDDPMIRSILKKIISVDYDLQVTESYNDFLEKLSIFEPEIIFLDLVLPDASGLDICRELKGSKKYSDSFILIVTGSTDKETIEKGYAAGADDFIRKPFLSYEIKSKIRIFSKIIQARNKLRKAYSSQVSFNTKLYALGDLIRENLSSGSIEYSFNTSRLLPDVIDVGYVELVRITGEKCVSLFNKSFDESKKYLSFEKLNSGCDFEKTINKRVHTLKIKKGEDFIYCSVSTILLNNVKFAYLIIQRDLPFMSEDRKMISLLTDFMSLLNKRFVAESLLESNVKNYKSEISSIRKIQVSTMPHFGAVRGYDIASAYLPQEELSGDFFDGFYVDDHVYQIVLCDVSGHGITSSYVGNEIRTLFRTASLPGRTPSEIVKIVNNLISESFTDFYYYCTALVFQILFKENKIVYLNAGHPSSLYYNQSDGSNRLLPQTGPIIGLFADNEYTDSEFVMQDGDTILLYTDGITEAYQNDYADMYGENRLIDAFVENQGQSSRDIIHSILGSVYEFIHFTNQHDDMTLICLRKDESSENVIFF